MALTSAYRENNKEALSEKRKTKYAENREEMLGRRRSYYAGNADAVKKSVAVWQAKNPETVKAIRRNRKARLKNSFERHTSEDIEVLLKLQKRKCAHLWCRVSLNSGYHVDHITPLKLNGSNGRKNLQLLCVPCNLSKSSKHPIEFAQQNGCLL